jgi:hypothetical protein
MYVCMYACMFACMHACMYVCTRVYVCMYVCMYVTGGSTQYPSHAPHLRPAHLENNLRALYCVLVAGA